MTSEERLTISRPEDLLGYIPHALGCWPSESLVAITMRGKTLGATLRVDLPGSLRNTALFRFAAAVRGYLAADAKADSVLLAVFTEKGWDDASVTGRTLPLLLRLRETLENDGLQLREAWLVGRSYWRSAFCTDPDCCPEPGRPVEQIRDSRLNAEMVFRGSNVRTPPGPGAGEEGNRGRIPDAAVLAAEDGYADSMARSRRSRKCLDAVLEAWNQALDRTLGQTLDQQGGAVPEAELAGFLRASLRVPAWRDAVAVMAAAGTSAAVDGAEAFAMFSEPDAGLLFEVPAFPVDPASPSAGGSPAGNPVPRMGGGSSGPEGYGYGDVLMGLYPGIPDWARMRALEVILSGLAEAGGGEARAAALTLRGWIEWCRGSGTFAAGFFELADDAHPGYRLAGLLGEVVRRGTVCGWALREEAAWRRLDGNAA